MTFLAHSREFVLSRAGDSEQQESDLPAVYECCARLRLFGNEDLPISRSLEPGAMQKRCCV